METSGERPGIRKLRIHDARHTYASLFVMSGGSVYDLKKVLGHADIKTTERYAHLSADHLAGVRDIIKPNIGIKDNVVNLGETLPQIVQNKNELRSVL